MSRGQVPADASNASSASTAGLSERNFCGEMGELLKEQWTTKLESETGTDT
jgi:hypothetical protein